MTKNTMAMSSLFVLALAAPPVASAQSIQMLPPVQSGTTDTVCSAAGVGKILSWDGATNIKCQVGVVVDGAGRVGIGPGAPSVPLSITAAGQPWYSPITGRTMNAQAYINAGNQTGGGVAISDDGGFFDWNDGFITFEPLGSGGGLRVNSNVTATGTVTPGHVSIGAGCSPAGAMAYDPGADSPVYCSSATGTWKSSKGGDAGFYVFGQTVPGTTWGTLHPGGLCEVANPYTGGCSCPPGTSAVSTGLTGQAYRYQSWDETLMLTICR